METQQQDVGIRKWLWPRRPSKTRVGIAITVALLLYAGFLTFSGDDADASTAPAALAQHRDPVLRPAPCSTDSPCPAPEWTTKWRDGRQGRTSGNIPENVQRMAYRAWMDKWSKSARSGPSKGLTHRQGWTSARRAGSAPTFSEWCDRSAGYTFLCKPVNPNQDCVLSMYVCNPKDAESNKVWINSHTDWNDVNNILSTCSRDAFFVGFIAGTFGGWLGLWGGAGGAGAQCVLDRTD